jgi:hypothetical protein
MGYSLLTSMVVTLKSAGTGALIAHDLKIRYNYNIWELIKNLKEVRI